MQDTPIPVLLQPDGMVKLQLQPCSAWRPGRAECSLKTLLGFALEAVQLAHCFIQGSQFWHLDPKVFRLLLHSLKVVKQSASHSGSMLPSPVIDTPGRR